MIISTVVVRAAVRDLRGREVPHHLDGVKNRADPRVGAADFDRYFARYRATDFLQTSATALTLERSESHV